MGEWQIHIEGHGLHDNGREDDADARLRQFVDQLRADGHQINSATLVIGAHRMALSDPENGGKTILGYRQYTPRVE